MSGPRRRGPKPGPWAEGIIETAFALLDEGGVRAFSMRKLAAALGVSGMAVYTYFPNRDALLRRLYDECVGQCPVAPPTAGTWRTRLRSHQIEIVEILTRYPGLSASSKGAGSSGPNGVRNRDAILRLLLDAGFDPERSAEIYGALSLLVLGCVATAERRGPTVVPAGEDGDEAMQLALQAYQRHDTSHRHFVALDVFLEALEHEVEPVTTRRSARSSAGAARIDQRRG